MYFSFHLVGAANILIINGTIISIYCLMNILYTFQLPVNYGPFTLYRYWKERELITYPFIKQCLGSRTIKFMLTNCYYNDKYYYEQFSKQFPGLIKVHKRAKCYSHMIMGFLLEIKAGTCYNFL